MRESAIAGSWYPGNREVLGNMLNGFLNNVDEQEADDLRALICPHAGYAYSGQVAAYSYRQVKEKKFSKVIIMAPSHQYPLQGVSISNYTHYRTPLGDAPVSTEAREMLAETDLIKTVDGAHIREHSAEIQIPFLQVTLKDFTIIPLVFGQMSTEEIKKIAEIILNHVNDSTLIIVSTDLSHYHPYDEAVSLDEGCIDAILSTEEGKAYEKEMCGKIPVLTIMEMAKKKRWSRRLLKYANSGDVTGDITGGVVGYASIGFYGKI